MKYILFIIVILLIIYYYKNKKCNEYFLGLIPAVADESSIPDNCKCACGDFPPNESYGIDNSCHCNCPFSDKSTKHTNFIKSLWTHNNNTPTSCSHLQQNRCGIEKGTVMTRPIAQEEYNYYNLQDIKK